MKIKKSKIPLTIYEKLGIDGQFKPEQLLQLLQQTPPEHIYRRPAKGGGTWEYVTGTWVKKVLNYVFGFLWSSEVRQIEEKYGQVSATVRLTIHKPDGSILLWKEDIGKKDIMFRKGTEIPLDYGNDKKSAITDGLKRCASQLSIASDVYGKEEFKSLKLEIVDIETPQEKSEEKERQRLIKYIESAGTLSELRQCKSSCVTDEAVELYNEKERKLLEKQ